MKYLKLHIKYIIKCLQKLILRISRDIIICPRCNEIIIDTSNQFSCPRCGWKKSFILQKVIDIKWLIISIIIILSLFIAIYKQIKTSENKMFLVKEYREKWTLYQYLIDNKGKRYIKMISADPDWMNNEIFVLDLSQDDDPNQKVKNPDGQCPKYFSDWIKNQFANKDNWK